MRICADNVCQCHCVNSFVKRLLVSLSAIKKYAKISAIIGWFEKLTFKLDATYILGIFTCKNRYFCFAFTQCQYILRHILTNCVYHSCDIRLLYHLRTSKHYSFFKFFSLNLLKEVQEQSIEEHHN